MTLRKLFEAVLAERSNTTGQSENRSKLYSELAAILNYAGIECNKLNIQEIRSGGLYIHVVVERREKVESQIESQDLRSPVERKLVTRTHVLPALLLDVETPLQIAQYWGLKQKLKESERETRRQAEALKQAQFKEFQTIHILDAFKQAAPDADVLIFQQLEAL